MCTFIIICLVSVFQTFPDIKNALLMKIYSVNMQIFDAHFINNYTFS